MGFFYELIKCNLDQICIRVARKDSHYSSFSSVCSMLISHLSLFPQNVKTQNVLFKSVSFKCGLNVTLFGRENWNSHRKPF